MKILLLIALLNISIVIGSNVNEGNGVGIIFPAKSYYFTETTISPFQILFPINVHGGLFLEPMLWFQNNDIDKDNEIDFYILLGLGVFYKKIHNHHNIYFGIRLSQISRNWEKNDIDLLEEDEDFYNILELGIGIESPINKSFSISGELFHNTTIRKEPKATFKYINPQLVLRFYI